MADRFVTGDSQSNRARQIRKGVNDGHWQTIRNNRSMIEQDQFIGRFLWLKFGFFTCWAVPHADYGSRCSRLFFEHLYSLFVRQNTQVSTARQFLSAPQ